MGKCEGCGSCMVYMADVQGDGKGCEGIMGERMRE